MPDSRQIFSVVHLLGLSLIALLCLCSTQAIAEVKRKPASKVIEVSRNQIDDEGSVVLDFGDRRQQLRLPASTSFDTGNQFLVDDMVIKVRHLSSNTPTPQFDLGRRKRALKLDPLFPEEKKILKYLGLDLFPNPKADRPIVSLDQWTADLDTFLKLHEKDQFLRGLVQAFVLNYGNRPPKGYLVGDQLWDNPRKFETWVQFYEMPLYYNLRGLPKQIDGKPYQAEPPRLSKEEFEKVEKLHRKVLRNLEYTFAAYKVQIEEGSYDKSETAYADVTCSRRAYLTFRILQEGRKLWEKISLR